MSAVETRDEGPYPARPAGKGFGGEYNGRLHRPRACPFAGVLPGRWP